VSAFVAKISFAEQVLSEPWRWLVRVFIPVGRILAHLRGRCLAHRAHPISTRQSKFRNEFLGFRISFVAATRCRYHRRSQPPFKSAHRDFLLLLSSGVSSSGPRQCGARREPIVSKVTDSFVTTQHKRRKRAKPVSRKSVVQADKPS
jgi:hypothetical protein